MRSIAPTCTLLAALLLPAPAFAAGDWSWPVHGRVITEFRNGSDPYAAGQHRGIDIESGVGTPVTAATGGTIVYAGSLGSSGLLVAERSSDGRYELSYLHLASIAVRRGQEVSAGDKLAAVGTTGIRSVEAAHLHFGVREAGDHHAYLDPLTFLAPPPRTAPEPRPLPVPVPARVGSPVQPASVAVHPAARPAPATLPAPALGLPEALGYPAAVASAAHAPYALRPARGPVPAPAHAHGAASSSSAAHPAGHRTAPATTAARGPAAGPRRAPGPHPKHAPAPARDTAPADRTGGIDVGWLAACAGLLLAAALLAGPAGGGHGRLGGRAAFAVLLRAASRG